MLYPRYHPHDRRAKKTVLRALVEVGMVCADYQDHVLPRLSSQRLQLDEMWAWIYCKEKNRTEEIAKNHPDAGDVWLWVAVDADTKLVPAWMLGQRDARTAKAFVDDLASRLSNRVQITTANYAFIQSSPLPGRLHIVVATRKCRINCNETLSPLIV